VKAVAYSRTAQKALTRMPRNLASRIRDKIRVYAADPAAQSNNVARLRGEEGLVRLRIGDWRIVMRDGAVLSVLHVTSRGSAYKE
jgi:mRNA interferase RelE/StbE